MKIICNSIDVYIYLSVYSSVNIIYNRQNTICNFISNVSVKVLHHRNG